MDLGLDDILDIISILFYYSSGACGVGMVDAELIFCTERGGLLRPPLFLSCLHTEVQYRLIFIDIEHGIENV